MDSSNFFLDLCPRDKAVDPRKIEWPPFEFSRVLTSSNTNTIVNNNDYQPSRADVSLHGGMEFEICTRINPISFKGSSIISTLGEWLCVHTTCEREMLDTNGLELGPNGVLSGHDPLKIGPCASTRGSVSLTVSIDSFRRWIN